MTEIIRSARNPSIQRLRRLSRRRSARWDDGAYVVEGATLLGEAVRAGARIESVFAESACMAEARAHSTVKVIEVGPGVLEKGVSTASPQGVAAVVQLPTPVSVADITPQAEGASSLVVVCVDLSDPGNFGAILRSAEAAGASAVVCAGESVDPYNPKVVRASAGAIFRLQLIIDGDSSTVLDQLGKAGYTRIAALARDGHSYDAVDMCGPVALVMGSEANGLSRKVAEQVDIPVTIPMPGGAESLNVAMAATVLCFEAARQRRSGSTIEGAQ